MDVVVAVLILVDDDVDDDLNEVVILVVEEENGVKDWMHVDEMAIVANRYVKLNFTIIVLLFF